jgi:hypothetical protein
MDQPAKSESVHEKNKQPGGMDTAIVVALVTVAGGAIGGLVSHLLLRWCENETRRLQLIRDRSAQQISEFYAPLDALIEQLDATATICNRIEGRDRDKPENSFTLIVLPPSMRRSYLF